VVTYLFTDPTLGLSGQDRVARGYAASVGQPKDALVGVAGTIPTQAEERRILKGRLIWVEIATLAAIALIVGLTFRSVVAPLVTLVTAGVGYLLADRVIGSLAGGRPVDRAGGARADPDRTDAGYHDRLQHLLPVWLAAAVARRADQPSGHQASRRRVRRHCADRGPDGGGPESPRPWSPSPRSSTHLGRVSRSWC
jgi:MMPL family